MTTYFDNRANEASRIRRALAIEGETSAVLDAIDNLDKAVVEDVSRVAEWPAKADRPACPEDIRDAIHRTVLTFSQHAQTSHAPSEWVCPDYEDTDAMLRGLETMISRLHDIFHALGRRGLVGYGDGPMMPMVNLQDDAVEAREALTAKMRLEPKREIR